jgi:hypothetical protein
VEGDEVAEAVDDAAVVNDAAVEGEAVAEALADDLETEPEVDAVEPDAVGGTDAATADADVSDASTSAAEADVQTPPTLPDKTVDRERSASRIVSEVGGRVRTWVRRRRNR